MCFLLVYRNKKRPPGHPSPRDLLRSLTCLLAFDLMVVSLVFWILYKTSTLAGLVSWRGKCKSRDGFGVLKPLKREEIMGEVYKGCVFSCFC